MRELHTIIGNLIDNEDLTGLNVSALFHPSDNSDVAIACNLSSCFLIILSGDFHLSFIDVLRISSNYY